MPPHCDTRDGPVVKAAIKALESGNLNYVLILGSSGIRKRTQDYL